MMGYATEFALAALSGYLCGTVPFAILVARAFKLDDPRSYGSGNPGATNVMRSGNKLAGRLVFAGDCLKGVLPVVAWRLAGGSEDAVAACAMAAVAGHVWSPWLGFRGGRGVATGLGVIAALDWPLGLVAVGCWGFLYLVSKTASIASVGAFVAAMLAAFAFRATGDPVSVAISAVALVIVVRHRQNIKDLLRGEERKF